ncbi:MAG: glycoside hydrolase family 3 N-terminal domain-containing protein, partial [Haliscomenobacter sp.]|uniref:glycoside hydrolase family 3 N-terminal domain-containing protein n=1 Tax=Haliscomenobacter sp. TaxID=2717303 RepID=UPI0029A0B444
MRMILSIGYLLLASVLFAQKAPEFLSVHNARWVDSTLQTMTLDQKIGQLFMPRGNTSGRGYDPQKLMNWVKEYHLGGIVFFAGQPSVQARITNELQAISKIPLLIGEDLEWGLAMRLDSTVRFPYQMTLGAMEYNEGLVEAMGREIGRQCKRMGVHVNYAPVVDINNNPNNPVINFRSFGEDKYNVTRKALAYMRGMQSQRILASAKHFPGHGDTGVDSHYDLPLISKNKQQLQELELYPYRELINNGLSGVMTAHLSIPALDSTKNLASTLSSRIVTDLLRKDLGFQGLVFTDAMDMQGAVKYYPNGEALVKAVLAGNELIETFEDVPNAFKAIKKAIADGLLKEADLNKRVRRILMAKSWVGLDKYQPIQLKNLIQDLNTIESDLLNRQMAEAALTLIKNQNEALPIRDLTQKIAVVSIDANQTTAFQKMASNYTNVDHFLIPINANDTSILNVQKATQNHDVLVIGVHLQNIRPGAKYGITESNLKALNVLCGSGKGIVVLFGNPYTLDKIPALDNAKAVIMAYQFTNYLEEAAAQAVFGAIPIKGKLPVTVNEKFPLAMGLATQSIGRLSYGIPEMVGISSKELIGRVDSIINLGLREKAYPGAVVQIAKEGRVIYQKNYGFHTYEDATKARSTITQGISFQASNKNDVMDEKVVLNNNMGSILSNGKGASNGAVQLNDLYDLASVTKISTSALAVMELMSAGKFDLDKTFADYYPEFANSNKANLTFRNMLTHRAGLRAFIPFWTSDIDSVQTVKNSQAYRDKYAAQLRLNFFQRLFGGKKKLDRKILTA